MASGIRERLLNEREENYRTFAASLLPTIDPNRIIGVRVPRLRKILRELDGQEVAHFLADLPHFYLEENYLHVFWISKIRDFDIALAEVERILPYIDSWATCDSLRPVAFAKQREKLLPKINEWLDSAHPYTVRFAIEMLMVHFLEDAFDPKHLDRVAAIKSEEYYVNMMIAWYFATALAKQYDSTLPYLEQKRLSPWIHAKTIQKAVESYRVSDEHKQHLKQLRLSK
ncbi:MAG: DNA alkylation repair protein [Clostridia bacterium]|nr:DNA alkylation repair protein [Clostridia bacterium]